LSKVKTKIISKLAHSTSKPDKFRKPLVSKEITHGWHYYKFFKNDSMIGKRLVLSDFAQVVEKGGEPVLEKNMPFFEWNEKTETRIITKEQYEQIIQSGFENE